MNFFFLMMVSQRTHPKDVKSEKNFEICCPLKRYSVLRVQFSAILLTEKAENGGKIRFQNAISFQRIGIFQKLFGNSQTKSPNRPPTPPLFYSVNGQLRNIILRHEERPVIRHDSPQWHQIYKL